MKFVQFYKHVQFAENESKMTFLQNGFSYVWDEAHPIWFNPNGSQDMVFDDEKFYVSALSNKDILTVRNWAIKHPAISFTVGGPAVWPRGLSKFAFAMPVNLSFMMGLAERIFNRKVNLKTWKIEVPQTENIVAYTYHISPYCYWNKCKFCTYTRGEVGPDRRSYDLEPLENAPPGVVILDSYSLSPNLFHIFKELNYKDKKYGTFIRGSKEETEKLKEILPHIPGEKLSLTMGIEFPSDRMLKWMGKGITVRELLDTINLLVEHRVKVRLSYITRWPNLIKEDLEEAKKFFEAVPKSPLLYHIFRPLAMEPGLNMENLGFKPNAKPNKYGILEYNAVLDREHQEFDKQYLDMFSTCQAVFNGFKNQ